MSEKDYLALPETTSRMELVDGLVVCEPSATFEHQQASMSLGKSLANWAASRSPRPDVLAAPLDVRFGPSLILQPDILVYCAPLIRPVSMPLTRIPDLCVEIVSTRAELDRTRKRMLYAQAGVAEMWTVVRARRVVERWTGPLLAEREECSETLATPLLPGFALDVALLFADELAVPRDAGLSARA